MSSIKQKARAFLRHENETLDIAFIDIPCTALPKELDGYRVAVVADLHLTKLTPYHGHILRALHQIQPGCILIAGDSTDDRTEDVHALTPFFSQMSAIAPAIAVLGNNDCDGIRTPILRTVYHFCGITLLENETRMLSANGFPLRITGLTDPHAFKQQVHVERKTQAADGSQVPLERVTLQSTLPPQWVKARDGTRVPYAPPEQADDTAIPSILLLHQPQLALPYAKLGASLIVAGHAHGGQIRVPLLGGLFAPGQGVLPKYTSGLYAVGDTKMLVSRGLGNHTFGVRLGNRPHLPVAVLRRESEGKGRVGSCVSPKTP